MPSSREMERTGNDNTKTTNRNQGRVIRSSVSGGREGRRELLPFIFQISPFPLPYPFHLPPLVPSPSPFGMPSFSSWPTIHPIKKKPENVRENPCGLHRFNYPVSFGRTLRANQTKPTFQALGVRQTNRAWKLNKRTAYLFVDLSPMRLSIYRSRTKKQFCSAEAIIYNGLPTKS